MVVLYSCPTGWHVPSNAEWVQLADYLHSQSQYNSCSEHHVAKALASETGWNSYDPEMDINNPHHVLCCVGNQSNSNNATGFNAFPAGFYGAFYYGCFTTNIGIEANFWSTTEHQNVSFIDILGCSLILGLDIGGLSHSDHYTEGVVQVMMDAIQQADTPLTEQRLFNWHAALFPSGRSGITPITVAGWRTGKDPMLVVSGAMGKEKIHYEAPPSDDVPRQMQQFIQWFNSEPGARVD